LRHATVIFPSAGSNHFSIRNQRALYHNDDAVADTKSPPARATPLHVIAIDNLNVLADARILVDDRPSDHTASPMPNGGRPLPRSAPLFSRLIVIRAHQQRLFDHGTPADAAANADDRLADHAS
jgi:hypothetical protein